MLVKNVTTIVKEKISTEQLNNANYISTDNMLPAIKNVLINLGLKAAQPGLNQPDVKSIRLLLPSEDAIDKFNQFADPLIDRLFNAAKINNRDYVDRNKELKIAIQQDAALHTLATNPLLLSIIAKFVNSVIFWSIAIDIAKNGSEYVTANLNIDIDKWNCRSMIDSAIENSIKNDVDIGQICTNYSESDIRLYHMKNDGKHIFTIFFYNQYKRIVERHQIILPCNFSLEYLREQIEKENIKSYLSEYIYLDQLKESEMTKEELKELFDRAYEDGRLLMGEAWHQLVIDKIAEDGEVFYKYFARIKREISPYEKLDISGLKGEYQIYFKYLFNQRRAQFEFFELSDNFDAVTQDDAIGSVGSEDKEQIISIYNNTEDEEHKAVLYEILYNLRNIE